MWHENRSIESHSINGTNNVANQSSTMVPEPPLYLIVLLSGLFSAIFLLGILGNVLVIVVVCRGRNLWSSVNDYILSLCISDLLVIVVCMPTAWVDVYAQDVWYFGQVMCQLVPYLENVVAGASVYTILFICVERYRAICSPLRPSNKTRCDVMKTISIIWSLSALACLPFLMLPVFRNSVWLDGTPIKVCRHPISYPWQKAYLVSISAIFFILPLLIIAVLYGLVVRVLLPDADNACYRYDESQGDKMKQKKQGLNIVLLIVSVFFLSHLPYRVISIWLIFVSSQVLATLGLEAYLAILYFARVTFYLNHALNPILYNFVSTKFRSELRSIWSPRTSYITRHCAPNSLGLMTKRP